MSLGAITVGLSLLVLSAYIITTPWRVTLWRSAAGTDAGTALKLARASAAPAVEWPEPLSLERQRDAAYAALADLDVDHELGKVNAEDYQRTRAALLTQAVAILQELDQAQADLEAQVETLVRGRRKSFLTCGNCGGSLDPEDKFCSHCGVPAQARCPKCNTRAAADDRFCRACGTALA